MFQIKSIMISYVHVEHQVSKYLQFVIKLSMSSSATEESCETGDVEISSVNTPAQARLKSPTELRRASWTYALGGRHIHGSI